MNQISKYTIDGRTPYNIQYAPFIDDCRRKVPPQRPTQLQPHTFNHRTFQQPPTLNIRINNAPNVPRPGRWQAPSCQRSHWYPSGDLRPAGACSSPPELDRIQDSFRTPIPCCHSLFFPGNKIIIPKTDMSNRIPTWTGPSCRFVCLSLKTGSTPMLWRYAFPREIRIKS